MSKRIERRTKCHKLCRDGQQPSWWSVHASPTTSLATLGNISRPKYVYEYVYESICTKRHEMAPSFRWKWPEGMSFFCRYEIISILNWPWHSTWSCVSSETGKNETNGRAHLWINLRLSRGLWISTFIEWPVKLMPLLRNSRGEDKE